MDQHAFQFATRGHCKKVNNAPHYNRKLKTYLCSNQSSLFSFYAEPSIGKRKGALVNCNPSNGPQEPLRSI